MLNFVMNKPPIVDLKAVKEIHRTVFMPNGQQLIETKKNLIDIFDGVLFFVLGILIITLPLGILEILKFEINTFGFIICFLIGWFSFDSLNKSGFINDARNFLKQLLSNIFISPVVWFCHIIYTFSIHLLIPYFVFVFIFMFPLFILAVLEIEWAVNLFEYSVELIRHYLISIFKVFFQDK